MRYSLSSNQLKAHDLAIRDIQINNLYSNRIHILHPQSNPILFSNKYYIDWYLTIFQKQCIKFYKKIICSKNPLRMNKNNHKNPTFIA